MDGLLDGGQSEVFERHLASCPLCRERVSEIRSIRNDLRMLSRRAVPASVSDRTKRAVREEIRAGRIFNIPAATREWIQMRLIPIAVGVVASVVIGTSILSILFSSRIGTAGINGAVARTDSRIMIDTNKDPYRRDQPGDILAADYARTRLAVAGESPSINPQGALIALSRSLVRGGMKNDEVVVVADVFSNGLAQIAQVVEPSRDTRAVDDLEKALVSDPSNAPFVPADLDKRSDNVRVVLKFQSVEVNTRKSRR